jgi:UTP--glucose-1-phosphate uridylyltransferase
MIRLLATQDFHAVKYDGRAFDCGSKLGFLLANVAYALDRPELGETLRAEIKKLI